MQDSGLPEPVRAAWFDLIRVMTQLPAALDRQLQADAGITCVEFYVLEHLAGSPDQTARLSSIARLANTTLSRMSHVSSRLEADGLLTRATDPDDRRATLATLTDAGQALLTRAGPAHWRFVQTELLGQMNASDLQALARISTALLQPLQQT
ncbi:MarR family winged helix-turn-helix transcriptional regulator [Amnibacterium endophyticum]|uniref:MarR family winged helix-turn-helix transcriptional regulator n=1 Tax=Amnibacterium endophyticum TaxID=2109337 RepID=A0ABW4LGR5_9MICO